MTNRNIARPLPPGPATPNQRHNGVDEQMKDVQSSTSDGSDSPTLIYVTEEECKILQALKSEYPELLTQAKIAKLIGLDVGRRTIQKRLPILRDVKKLVVQPDGPKSGYGLSDAGWKAVTTGM